MIAAHGIAPQFLGKPGANIEQLRTEIAMNMGRLMNMLRLAATQYTANPRLNNAA